MSTKADIESLIDTNLATASGITAAEVRDVLKDNANSLLENFYSTEQIDSDATENILTLTNPGDVDFTIRVLKTGRKVSISGTLFNNSGSNITNIGVITAGELTAITGRTYYANGYVRTSGDTNGISITNSGGVTSLLCSPGLAPLSTTTEFSIFYYTNN